VASPLRTQGHGAAIRGCSKLDDARGICNTPPDDDELTPCSRGSGSKDGDRGHECQDSLSADKVVLRIASARAESPPAGRALLYDGLRRAIEASGTCSSPSVWGQVLPREEGGRASASASPSRRAEDPEALPRSQPCPLARLYGGLLGATSPLNANSLEHTACASCSPASPDEIQEMVQQDIAHHPLSSALSLVTVGGLGRSGQALRRYSRRSSAPPAVPHVAHRVLGETSLRRARSSQALGEASLARRASRWVPHG